MKSVLNIHWKDWCWSWNSNTLTTWYEELTHMKKPWCWERLKAGGEGDDRGWDGCMASLTWCTWVWASSRSWWWTGKPGMLQSMWSQRVGHDWATELTNRLNQFDEKVHQLALILHCHFWSTVHKLKPRQPVLLSWNNCCCFWLTSERVSDISDLTDLRA